MTPSDPTILNNGTIRAMDGSAPASTSLAIVGDRVGRSSEPTAQQTPVDLGGRCVVPGFTDSHTHFPTWAILRRWLNLEDCNTGAATLARVSAAAAGAPADRWLAAYGWSGEPWRAVGLSPREALDAVTGDVPTALWSNDMHTFWLNSAAIARAPRDAAAGELDERGEPTGILREWAGWDFREHQLVSVDEYANAVIDGIEIAHARGVTAVHDKDGWIGAPAIWNEVRDRGKLGIRVWQSVPPDRISAYEDARASSVPGDFLRIGYVKVFVDGSLGSGTALMANGSGVTTTSEDELREILREVCALGWPVAVHAIGDEANRIAIDAFEVTRDIWEPQELRQRIEHAQHIRRSDIARFGALGIACSVQFADGVLSRDAVDDLSAAVREGSFAFRTLWDSGACVVNGSDAPLTELDPLAGIRAAVLRTVDGRPPWRPEQALTATEALEATTVKPAWLCGEEHVRGRLVPGQLADLVVLNRDPVTCEEGDLADLEVVATMVGGEWVHNPPPWD